MRFRLHCHTEGIVVGFLEDYNRDDVLDPNPWAFDLIAEFNRTRLPNEALRILDSVEILEHGDTEDKYVPTAPTPSTGADGLYTEDDITDAICSAMANLPDSILAELIEAVMLQLQDS